MLKSILIILLAFLSCGPTIKKREPVTKTESFSVFKMHGGIFDTEMVVVISQDTLQTIDFVNYMFEDTSISIKDFAVRGVCFFKEGCAPIMWLPKPPVSTEDVSIVNHELFHLTRNVLTWAHVPLDDSSEEVYAFTLQFLTKQFYDNINKL